MPSVVMDLLGHCFLMHYDCPFSWLLGSLNGIAVITKAATQKWDQSTAMKASRADHIASALFIVIIQFVVLYLQLGRAVVI